MELFSDVITGPYAFLVTLQILIICGLLLAFVWLMIQRARDLAEKDAPGKLAEPAATVAAPAPVVAATPAAAMPPDPVVVAPPVEAPVVAAPIAEAAPPPVVEASPVITEVSAPSPVQDTAAPVVEMASPVAPASPIAMESQATTPATADEATALKDKVRYLESRLMEYEIVQEEISALSQLRVENEKLKEELLKAQGGKPPSVGAPPSEPKPEATVGPRMTPPVQDPSGIPPAAQPNPVLSSVSSGQIDSILKKLDEITNKPGGA